MHDEPRWLSDREQEIWRSFARLLTVLPAALDSQLARDADLVQYSYWVLAMLSEAPQHELRMSELAARSNSSQSRLSHIVGRLEGRGFLVRRRAADDGRGAVAVLTGPGLALINDLAPQHVATVRALVVDALTPAQLEQLGVISETLLAAVARYGCPATQ